MLALALFALLTVLFIETVAMFLNIGTRVLTSARLVVNYCLLNCLCVVLPIFNFYNESDARCKGSLLVISIMLLVVRFIPLPRLSGRHIASGHVVFNMLCDVAIATVALSLFVS